MELTQLENTAAKCILYAVIFSHFYKFYPLVRIYISIGTRPNNAHLGGARKLKLTVIKMLKLDIDTKKYSGCFYKYTLERDVQYSYGTLFCKISLTRK